MTVKELEKKYKGYEFLYWGKGTFIKTLKDCKEAIPFSRITQCQKF